MINRLLFNVQQGPFLNTLKKDTDRESLGDDNPLIVWLHLEMNVCQVIKSQNLVIMSDHQLEHALSCLTLAASTGQGTHEHCTGDRQNQ